MKKINCTLIFVTFFAISLISQEQKSNLDKANNYFKDGKFSLAEMFYVRALKEHPDDYKANLNLGKIYYRQQMYDKALTTLQMAYDLNSSDEIMFIMANCYVDGNKPRKGLSIYSNLMASNPNNADYHLNAGVVGYKRLYNKHITITHWEKFLTLRPHDPQSPDIRKALKYLKDPKFVLKPPDDGTNKSQAGILGPGGGLSPELEKLKLPEIKGKDLESDFLERYKSRKKKGL